MRIRQLLQGLGLHPGHELLLMHLWDAGPQRQADLAAVFDTDSASMSRTVQRVERAGFVRRRPDPNQLLRGLQSLEASLSKAITADTALAPPTVGTDHEPRPG
jgi:DNA-binding MarR family transcriptional regulator